MSNKFNQHLQAIVLCEKGLLRCVRTAWRAACLPVWQSVCPPAFCPLPRHPLTLETCSTFRPASPHFPPSTAFILLVNPSASWEACIWVRDVLWMESSADSGQASQSPSIFCPHPLEHLFQMWLFLTPCAISLPDLSPISASVWLGRQFHRIAKKRPPEKGSQTPCTSTLSVLSPCEALIWTVVAKMFLPLSLLSCRFAARCTGGCTLMHGGTHLWISHFLLLGSFIKFPFVRLCHSLSPRLFVYLSFCLPLVSLSFACTHTNTHAHIHSVAYCTAHAAVGGSSL